MYNTYHIQNTRSMEVEKKRRGNVVDDFIADTHERIYGVLINYTPIIVVVVYRAISELMVLGAIALFTVCLFGLCDQIITFIHTFIMDLPYMTTVIDAIEGTILYYFSCCIFALLIVAAYLFCFTAPIFLIGYCTNRLFPRSSMLLLKKISDSLRYAGVDYNGRAYRPYRTNETFGFYRTYRDQEPSSSAGILNTLCEIAYRVLTFSRCSNDRSKSRSHTD
jgi:hypothetical protein